MLQCALSDLQHKCHVTCVTKLHYLWRFYQEWLRGALLYQGYCQTISDLVCQQ